MAKKKSRKPKRPKYSADKPLELTVAIPRLEAIPPPAWRAALSRPVEAFVDALPEVADTASGRKKAQTIRAVLGVGALFMVIAARDGDWWLGAIGVVLGVALVFVPMSGLRKARWKHKLARVAGAGQREVFAPSTLHFNGTKLTVRGPEGKVWRSARPFVVPHVVVWGLHDGAAWLGILNPKGKKRDALWLHGPDSSALIDDGARLTDRAKAHVGWALDTNVESARCDAEAFAALFAVLGPDPRAARG